MNFVFENSQKFILKIEVTEKSWSQMKSLSLLKSIEIFEESLLLILDIYLISENSGDFINFITQ